MTTAAQQADYHEKKERVLYLALELSADKWRLGLTTGHQEPIYEKTILAGNPTSLKRVLESAKRRFGLGSEVRVESCYEAGRDGFWVHRFLKSLGVNNRVVDSSSIEVNRRARRAKSDGLDVRSLLRHLMREQSGEKKVWSVVRVPSRQDEDERQLQRELKNDKKTRTAITNRIRGLLSTQGIRIGAVNAKLKQKLSELRCWDRSRLPAQLLGRLEREVDHWVWVHERILGLRRQRAQKLREGGPESVGKVRQMMVLRAIGVETAWTLEYEVFSWREIRGARQLGSYLGLVPSPYQSGDSNREQGISKAGNRHVRAVAIQTAWAWLRYQPHSPITHWFESRFAHAGKRARKVGVVAVARKVMIELWRYRQTGVLPTGALLSGETH